MGQKLWDILPIGFISLNNICHLKISNKEEFLIIFDFVCLVYRVFMLVGLS